jgi:hypothetical protein
MRSKKSGPCDLELPRRRRVLPRVERGDAAEVLEQVGADRRVDVDARRDDARIHLLLDQAGVKVPGVERHEAHGHRRGLLSGRAACGDERHGQHRQRQRERTQRGHHRDLLSSWPG